MYRKSAQPPIPAPPTMSRRTGIGIRYGCHDPCFHEFAKLSIAALSFSGRRMANTPKLRKSAAMTSAAGASLRLGIAPCIPQKSNTGHTTVEVGVLSEIKIFRQARCLYFDRRCSRVRRVKPNTTHSRPLVTTSQRLNAQTSVLEGAMPRY